MLLFIYLVVCLVLYLLGDSLWRVTYGYYMSRIFPFLRRIRLNSSVSFSPTTGLPLSTHTTFHCFNQQRSTWALRLHMGHLVCLVIGSALFLGFPQTRTWGIFGAVLTALNAGALVMFRNCCRRQKVLWITHLLIGGWPIGNLFIGQLSSPPSLGQDSPSIFMDLMGISAWVTLSVLCLSLHPSTPKWAVRLIFVVQAAVMLGGELWFHGIETWDTFLLSDAYCILTVLVPTQLVALVVLAISSITQETIEEYQDRLTSAVAKSEELQMENARWRSTAGHTATLAHEVRTPLNALLACCTLLGDSPLNPQQREYVQLILSCGSQITNNVDHVLEYSRLQEKQIQFESKPFVVDELCRGCLDMVRFLAEKKQLDLRINCGKEKITLLGDPGRLQQALMNLLTNAIKFTEKGFVSLTATVSLGGRHARPMSPSFQPARLSLEIRDSGIGMSPDQYTSLFRPFQQASSATWSSFGGSGLGLVISQQLIELMGGELKVDEGNTALGVGSCFTIELPCPLIKWETPLASTLVADPVPPSIAAGVAAASNNHNNAVLPASKSSETASQGSGAGSKPISEKTATATTLSSSIPATRTATITNIAESAESSTTQSRSLSFGRIMNVFDEESVAFSNSQSGGITVSPAPRPLATGSTMSLARERASLTGWSVPPSPSSVSRRRKASGALSTTAGTEDEDPLFTFATHTVMVVDDNEVNRLVMCRLLLSIGFVTVLPAQDGETALKLFKEYPNVHLVFTDIYMPRGMNGWRLAAAIRETVVRQQLALSATGQVSNDARTFAWPVIIAVSGAVDQDLQAMCVQHGIDAFLAKPITRPQLHAIASRWLLNHNNRIGFAATAGIGSTATLSASPPSESSPLVIPTPSIAAPPPQQRHHSTATGGGGGGTCCGSSSSSYSASSTCASSSMEPNANTILGEVGGNAMMMRNDGGESDRSDSVVFGDTSSTAGGGGGGARTPTPRSRARILSTAPAFPLMATSPRGLASGGGGTTAINNGFPSAAIPSSTSISTLAGYPASQTTECLLGASHHHQQQQSQHQNHRPSLISSENVFVSGLADSSELMLDPVIASSSSSASPTHATGSSWGNMSLSPMNIGNNPFHKSMRKFSSTSSPSTGQTPIIARQRSPEIRTNSNGGFDDLFQHSRHL